jgi:hypothetical protein
MSLPEDRLKILKQIQEGKLSAEEGVKLLDSLENHGQTSGQSGQPNLTGNNSPPRWLRIKITDLNSAKEKYNLRLPANVINAGFKMGAKFSPDMNGIDTQSVLHALQIGETGKIIDLCDDDTCQRIEITLEP